MVNSKSETKMVKISGSNNLLSAALIIKLVLDHFEKIRFFKAGIRWLVFSYNKQHWTTKMDYNQIKWIKIFDVNK